MFVDADKWHAALRRWLIDKQRTSVAQAVAIINSADGKAHGMRALMPNRTAAWEADQRNTFDSKRWSDVVKS